MALPFLRLLALQYTLPNSTVIFEASKIADMMWIWEVFNVLMSFGT
jgi:hypothetical protein